MKHPLVRWVVSGFKIERRPTDQGPYVVLQADLVGADSLDPANRFHHVELTASPTGRNLHVYVDGERYERADP